MNIIGKWKLKAICLPTENGPVSYTEDTIPTENAEVFAENRDMLLEFLEDGTLNTIVKAEGEYLAMAEESGVEPREDGYIVAMSTSWENRGGKFYYNSELEGEILGDTVDPFIEIGITDDGCIMYNYGMFVYERV